MPKILPATLEGLACAVALKKLHPHMDVCLGGESDEKASEFSQFYEMRKCSNPSISEIPSLSSLVLEMKNKSWKLSKDEAELFACAIFNFTNALTSDKTRVEDVEALAYCFKFGGKLSRLSVKLSFSKFFKKAREIMTSPVRYVHISSDLNDVKTLVERTGFSGFPVVNEDGKLIGVVTKKDVERALKAGISDLQMVMSIPPIKVREDDDLDEVGEIMAVHDVGRVIVVNGENTVKGIITRRDLVRAFTALNGRGVTTISLASKLNEVDDRVAKLLTLVKDVARLREERAYIVGGFVRDLLMNKRSLDLDIVIEGNGSDFAREIANYAGGRLKVHDTFNTATVYFEDISLDIATARSEYYENPGSLPKVENANLRKDLYRRDFTINAMAISLNEDFGTLIDFFGGRRDLEQKKIRVLHSMSFVEDPTRILRALRYAARFEFTLEEKTHTLLKNALNRGYLKSVSASRIRRELEKSLSLQDADVIFERFQSYSIFDFFPCWRKVDFKRYFKFVREMRKKIHLFYSIILLLLKPCKKEIVENVFKKYGVPKKLFFVFSKVYDERLLEKLKGCLSNSELFFLLSAFEDEALAVLAYEDEKIHEKIRYFNAHLRDAKLTQVNGKMLKEMGFKGSTIGKIMRSILALKLDRGMDEIEALKILTKGDKN